MVCLLFNGSFTSFLLVLFQMLHGQEGGNHTNTSYNADNLTCTNPNFLNTTDAPIWHEYTNTLLQFLTGTVGIYF